MSNKPNILKKDITLQDGRTISLETGQVAKQADGSVILRMDNTMLLATVVSAKEVKEGMNFLPLTVNYQEQYAAAGRFPGGFFKREGRPSSYEIVISRLIDRALRPLFPEDYRAETQILISLISADKNVMPDSLAGLAASAALTLSDVPFSGPISEVRVARINGELVVNPYIDQLNEADMDIMVAGTEEEINMVEGEMDEATEEDMVEALKFAHKAIQDQCKALKAFEKEAGFTEKRSYEGAEEGDEALRQEVDNYFRDKIYEIAQKATSKPERSKAFDDLFEEYINSFDEEADAEKLEQKDLIKEYFDDVKKDVVRNLILHDRKRLDGRKLDEVRPIDIEVDFLPSAHGSALFTRGETQSLTSVTLGSKLDKQMIDEVMFESYEKFILHYNFPPFSTGEAKMLRGTSRREIGHGQLAQRALEKVLPSNEDNPYTVRVVSDILESNGSSSMATVCAGSLALMDAGIKIRKPVSGIAMGAIIDDQGNYGILSDILGDEDHLGDMDFKVSGTPDGITACQMDLKVEGLSYDMLTEALRQAREGRLHILDKMNEAISEPRQEFKPNAPRIEKLFIDKEFIGTVIGPGGKHITKLQEDTGTEITVDQDPEKGQGIVEIKADNKEQLEEAKTRVQKLIEVPEEGKIYTGKVESIQPFGAIIEFLPGKTGLLHISEIAWERTESVEDVMEEGQEIDIKLKSIDEKTGRFSLTRKELFDKPEGYKEPEKNGKGDKFKKKGPPPHKKGGPRNE